VESEPIYEWNEDAFELVKWLEMLDDVFQKLFQLSGGEDGGFGIGMIRVRYSEEGDEQCYEVSISGSKAVGLLSKR